MLGKRLGSYEIIEEIGSGGMATVYRAYHPAMDRFVAVKVLKESLALDKANRERFNREAKLIARLEHPYLLPIYDFSANSSPAYIVMRYLEGTSLKTVLETTDSVPFHEIIHLCRQIASVLDYAHSHGVIHRDIKPANILLDTEGNAFLTDFGIATVIGDRDSYQKGLLLGTPAYMSPEQVLGKAKIGPATDIYSLAVVIFEMATGQLPFDAPELTTIMKQHVGERVPYAELLNPRLPNNLDVILHKALAKKPAQRFSSAGEIWRELESLIKVEDALRPPDTLRKVAREEVRQRLENRNETQIALLNQNFESNRNTMQQQLRAVKESLKSFKNSQRSSEQATQIRKISKRGAYLYYFLILMLFFVFISVALLIGVMGLLRSQPLTAQAEGDTIANVPTDASLVFNQTAVFNEDTDFEVNLNPHGANLVSLFAAAESTIVFNRADETGLYLTAAPHSFFVADSGEYTFGVEIGYENQPDSFFYLEAGESCVGIDYLSEEVLYMDCLRGACSYRLGGPTGSKQILPAGQRLVAGFADEATQRVMYIPEAAILHYQSFLAEMGAEAESLGCLQSYAEL